MNSGAMAVLPLKRKVPGTAPTPILSQKCVRSDGIDVVPLGVKTAASPDLRCSFRTFKVPRSSKTLSETADLNQSPHVILVALFGALLCNVAYGPGTRWLEERTA